MDNVKFGDFRVDYIKCTRSIHTETAVKLRKLWDETFDQEHIYDGKAHQAKVQSVRSEGEGKYLYTFEAWGPTCANCVELDLQEWAPFIERVDIRYTCPVTARGLDTLYQVFTKSNSAHRNIQRFDTRPRTKERGRNAGGIGLALGSHKSDFRIVIYKRPSEPGALEFNLAGPQLDNAKRVASLMLAKTNDRWNDAPWRNFILMVAARGLVQCEKASGLKLAEIQQFAEGYMAEEDIAEDRVAQADALMGSMTLEEIARIHEMAQKRLFPHE